MKTLSLCLGFMLLACGGDDGGDPTPGTPDAALAIDADTTPNGEPCDFQNPASVTVGQTITADVPDAACGDSLHFYEFVPAQAGVYQIVKSGAGGLGFCETQDGGCICGIDINCCTACTLTFDLPDGSPLPAGSMNEIYIDGTGATGPYTFTVMGPL